MERVLSSSRFILGPEVRALETEVAGLSGVRHGVGVASGSDALALALRALGHRVGAGVPAAEGVDLDGRVDQDLAAHRPVERAAITSA